ncbi:DotA/TraY family protein [Komagataeibacter sp. FNDCR2]|uniref:DotA/TraY family protein n=1 Tax=Komagataeibacter sp. FNDCR2 TaxID=2878682 RepID=UPI001E42070C|nr:DotA/TraY family protein [Komagataeibacter sp. FNDCR2]
MLDSIFPMSGSTQTATGTMLSYFSAYVMLIVAAWISYATVIQIHRTAESGKIFSASFNGWVPVRVAMALIMMSPVTALGGFSTGQDMILVLSKSAIGMARNLQNITINAVGPDALPLAEPMAPSTREIIFSVMASELCRAIVNKASNNGDLIPAPEVQNNGAGKITLSYDLAANEHTAAAPCGSIVLQLPTSNAGISSSALAPYVDLSDLAPQEQQALKDLVSKLRDPIQALAATLWVTRNVSTLRSLDALLIVNAQSYSDALYTIASSAVSTIRKAASDQGADSGVTALHNLGWSGLGAYYLEIAGLNSEILAFSSLKPAIIAPSWTGLGWFLSDDVDPFARAIGDYLAQQEDNIITADQASAPYGATRMFSRGRIGSTPGSLLTQITRAVGINEDIFTLIVNEMVAPSSGVDSSHPVSGGGPGWTDPLAGMITLGHLLIHIALTIIGVVAIGSSKTASAASAVAGVMTLDPAQVAASASAVVFSGAISALLTPIFAGAFMLLVPGITLAYILPMTPYLYWIAGVAGWLILVIEAVIAVPLWMLAHMVFEGEGLHGRGIRGYEVLFTIIFRPSMMVIGLILSYTIFSAMSWLLMKSFSIAVGFVFAQGDLVDNFIAIVVMLAMYVTTEMTFAVMSFRLISTLPHHLPAMAGMNAMSRVDSDSFSDSATQPLRPHLEKGVSLAQSSISRSPGTGNDAPDPASTSGTKGLDSTTQSHLMVSGREEG